MDDLKLILKSKGFNDDQINQVAAQSGKNLDDLSKQDISEIVDLALAQRDGTAIAPSTSAKATTTKKGKVAKKFTTQTSAVSAEEAIAHASREVSDSIEAFKNPILEGVEGYAQHTSDEIVGAIANAPKRIQDLVAQKALALEGDPQAFRQAGRAFVVGIFGSHATATSE